MNTGKKILIADDDKDIVETIRFDLEHNGFEVITAYDGFEAFATTVAERPDLIILDVMMPKENGYRVSQSIKEGVDKNAFGKNIIVLLLTARVLEEPDREKMFMDISRADLMMYKPFEMDDLINKVKELLDITD